jgi:hypothetical protein
MKKMILQALAFLLTTDLVAQEAITNSGNLQFHTGASITGFGDFSNTSTASLVNNGSLYLKRNITNDQSSMSAGTGTVYLDGSIAQTIGGGQAFKAYNLFTSNAAGIVLNNNLSISGLHTFTSGLISSSITPNYLVYETGSSYTGDNDSRHVTGWVKKIGNTAFTFPVGDATYERTIAVTSLSASSEFNAHYYRTTPNIYNLWSPIVQVRAGEYWQLDKISGGTAQATLNWNHPKIPMDNIIMADILSAHYSSGNWTSTGGSASGNVTTTGTISSSAISVFGQMTLGYKTFPVPLRLISFTAERHNSISFLNWVTDNEENVDHFDVQRSYDAVNYSTIGKVTARNTGSRQVYSFEDHAALNGVAYYRIKSIDRDASFSYSRIAVVAENDNSSTDLYALNPARNAITVFNRTGHEEQFGYRLYTTTGQLLLKGNMNIGSNSGTALPLPPGVAAGLYLLEMENTKTLFRQKILVEK